MDDRIKQILALGREHYGKREFDRAEHYLKQVVERNLKYADVYNMLGVIHHDRGRFEDAQAYFEEALQINPSYTEAAINLSVTYNDRGKYDKAVACLTKDREALLAFFDFPAEHWDHLRTSNPIESVFATVRHRTVRTKGALSAKTAKLMVFKLVNAAAKTWRRLNGENQLPKVVQGVKFQNGIEVTEMPAHHAA